MIQQENLHILPRRVERILEAAELMSVENGVGEVETRWRGSGKRRERTHSAPEIVFQRTAFSTNQLAIMIAHSKYIFPLFWTGVLITMISF
jgi:hypothetical protein